MLSCCSVDWPYDDINAYLGVPFALPPTGARRFQPTAPFVGKYKNGVLEASAFGPACLQPKHSAFVNAAMSEDCLQVRHRSRLPPRLFCVPFAVQKY